MQASKVDHRGSVLSEDDSSKHVMCILIWKTRLVACGTTFWLSGLKRGASQQIANCDSEVLPYKTHTLLTHTIATETIHCCTVWFIQLCSENLHTLPLTSAVYTHVSHSATLHKASKNWVRYWSCILFVGQVSSLPALCLRQQLMWCQNKDTALLILLDVRVWQRS